MFLRSVWLHCAVRATLFCWEALFPYCTVCPGKFVKRVRTGWNIICYQNGYLNLWKLGQYKPSGQIRMERLESTTVSEYILHLLTVQSVKYIFACTYRRGCLNIKITTVLGCTYFLCLDPYVFISFSVF
jgi:hypothetical protein